MAKVTKPSKPAAKKAPAKKPAAKKAPAKKPAAKKAVKKPAAKAAVAKKVPAKKPAAKTAVKKPAAKAAVVKKVPAKKPAAKTAVKKPAAKAAVAKKVPAKKPAVKKLAAKAAPVKKPVQAKPAVKAAPVKAPPKTPVIKPVQKPPVVAKPPEPVFVFPNLFDAYNTNTLPRDQGLIITSAFRDNSAYTIYEITAYNGVKELSRNDVELRFVCERARKFYVLVEPVDYFFKYIMDPADRSVSDSIPYRKHELEVSTTVHETQIMIAKAARETAPEFAVPKPHGGDLAAVFSKTPDVWKTIAAFFRETFTKDLNIPQIDAEKASEMVIVELEKAVS
jgi:histone H1/5